MREGVKAVRLGGGEKEHEVRRMMSQKQERERVREKLRD